MEGLDSDVVDGRGLEGTSSGRIRSMLLLLIVTIDAAVVVGRDVDWKDVDRKRI